MKPLDGINVVDLTHALAGPFCTYQLMLLGARVIKIENPQGGDDFRGFARPMFDAVNAGKESVSLDLKRPRSLEILQRLVQRADVLVENFKPGTADKFGITWERVKDWNPKAIWCSITGFGLEGPWRDLPAVEWSVQAASGLTDSYVSEEADPQFQGLGVLDLSTGHAAATAILAALMLRAKTSVGQRLDVAMIDVALTLSGARVAADGPAPKVTRPAVGRFKAKDRLIFIMGAHQRWFQTISKVLGPPYLSEDPRFANSESRLTHAAALREAIESRLAARTAQEWEDLFTAAGLPAAVVRRTHEFVASEHVRQRGVVHRVNVADRNETIRVVGPPYRMPDNELAPAGPVPVLGAHTDAVLTELSYSVAQIAELRSASIL